MRHKRDKRDISDSALAATADRCKGCLGENYASRCEVIKAQGGCKVAASKDTATAAFETLLKACGATFVDVTPKPQRGPIAQILSKHFRKNKYGAIKTNCGQGHRHDSKAEAARCDYWQAEKVAGRILHVDIQPKVTLPGGSYRPDFCVWVRTPIVPSAVGVMFEDVKGVSTQVFKRIRKEFDKVHPAAPLRVVTLKGKKWLEA